MPREPSQNGTEGVPPRDAREGRRERGKGKEPASEVNGSSCYLLLLTRTMTCSAGLLSPPVLSIMRRWRQATKPRGAGQKKKKSPRPTLRRDGVAQLLILRQVNEQRVEREEWDFGGVGAGEWVSLSVFLPPSPAPRRAARVCVCVCVCTTVWSRVRESVCVLNVTRSACGSCRKMYRRRIDGPFFLSS